MLFVYAYISFSLNYSIVFIKGKQASFSKLLEIYDQYLSRDNILSEPLLVCRLFS